MLENIFKGFSLWVYGLLLDAVQELANSLLGVFSLDFKVFERYAPIIGDIQKIFIATGWALLIANLTFQAMRSMVAGLGVDAEDPSTLLLRTTMFGALLLASPQICQTGLSLTGTIIDMLKLPDSVEIATPDADLFPTDAGWAIGMTIGTILIFQVLKLFFEVGERYVIIAILSYMAPLAFAMGGSKSTEDIFRGWCRMFASMCFIMTSNVIFVKLMLSAMSTMPGTVTILPWLIFIVALTRVARRIDDLICRIGLNPAHTGGRGIGGMMAAYTIRAAVSAAGKVAAGASSGANNGNGRRPPPSASRNTPPRAPGPSGGGASSSGPGQRGNRENASAPGHGNGPINAFSSVSSAASAGSRRRDRSLDIIMTPEESAAMHSTGSRPGSVKNAARTSSSGAPAVAGSESHPAGTPSAADRAAPGTSQGFINHTASSSGHSGSGRQGTSPVPGHSADRAREPGSRAYTRPTRGAPSRPPLRRPMGEIKDGRE